MGTNVTRDALGFAGHLCSRIHSSDTLVADATQWAHARGRHFQRTARRMAHDTRARRGVALRVQPGEKNRNIRSVASFTGSLPEVTRAAITHTATKMRSPAPRLVVVCFAWALPSASFVLPSASSVLPSANSLRLLSPSPRVLRATRLTMAELSPSERLASLEKTLGSLREGGYAKEMLEPLQREIELLKVAAAAAPDTPPTAPPAAPPAAPPPTAPVAPPAAPPPTPTFVRPFDPDTGAGVGLEPPPSPPSPPPTSTAQPTPAFVRPFNPDSDGDEEAAPPAPPPRKKVNGINSLRLQTERNYVPAEGLNPAAELLRRRQEARRERGEPSGGGGGGGWFAGLGLSPEAKAARDQAQAAAVSHAPHTPLPAPGGTPTPAAHVHPRPLLSLGSAHALRRRQRPSRRRSWPRPPSGSRRKPRCS